MVKFRSVFTILILTWCGIFQKGYTQENKIPGIILNSAFIEDSAISFNNYYSRHNILYPISKSPAAIELRYYSFGNFNNPIDRILIIKVDGKKVLSQVFALYNRSYRNTKTSDVAYKDSLRYMPGAETKYKNTINWDSTFTLLTTNNILLIGSEDRFIDSLKEKGVLFKNPCLLIDHCIEHFNLVEIKVGKKIRNFQLSFPSYFITNKNVSKLEAWYNIEKLLSFILQNTRREEVYKK